MAKTAQKHLIWSSFVDVNDYRGLYQEFIEENELDIDPDDENALLDFAVEDNYESLCCERLNLDVCFNRPIVIIGDLGLWNGRRPGYKMIYSGNIKDYLYADSDSDIEWFVDGYKNFRANEYHHDGTNYYLYRVFKESISDEQIENFLDKIYRGVYTSSDVSRYTESVGKYICDVYGF